MLKSISKILFCSVILTLVGCSSMSSPSHQDISAKEKLYESTKNYNALISLYRTELKHNENPITRYKLANSYYYSGDSQSSLLYLEPLLKSKNQVSEKAGVLQLRNLIQLHDYQKTVSSADMLVKQYPNNGEIYNLRGIAFANLGKLNEARNDINRAREFFINDTIAINNLAMLSIINGDYRNASEILLPQYLNGVKDQKLVHNLVFALVKSGDIDYAKDIIRKERLNTSPESLVEALQKTERVSSAVRK